MKRTLLLSSAAIALTLGLTPAMAQQDRTDSKMKHEPAATEQHDRDTSKRPVATKDEAGAAKAAGQADHDKAKAAETDKAKSGADSAKAPEKAAESDKSSAQPKQAQDEKTSKPADKAAADKSKTAEPTKNAERQDSRSPDARKAAESKAPERNAPANAEANDSTKDANRNAQTNEPNRNAAARNDADQKTRISASLDPQKKTRVTTAFEKVNVRPVTNVNFSVSIGVAVPRTIEVHPVPASIVEIVPQYRGYDFFIVREEVVIVEPRTHKIVDVIERGPSRARAETTTTVRKPQFSAQQREIIRKHARTRRTTTTTTTTGAGPRTEIEVGHRLPDSVEIETFPEEVYREVPAVREYRYIERGDDLYLVDPSSREVIEEVR
jgi:hypothetical protein